MSEWLQIDVERALYVDRGANVILCDRLPSPVTLVVELSDAALEKLRAAVKQK